MAAFPKTSLLDAGFDDTALAIDPGFLDPGPGEAVVPDQPPADFGIDTFLVPPPAGLIAGGGGGGDPEPVAVLAVVASSAAKTEGTGANKAFTFLVSRTGDTTTAASAAWSVAGQGVHAASAADFAAGVLPSGTVSFAPGQVSKTISVVVKADSSFESDEGFAVKLSAPSPGAILMAGKTTAYGTILDDDKPTVSIAAQNAVKLEGTGNGVTPFTFDVTRTGDLSLTASVGWTASTAWQAGSATNFDFAGGVIPGGDLTFAPGETHKLITVNIVADNEIEPDEEFSVHLGYNGSGTAIGTSYATATILSDDHYSFAYLEESTPSLVEGNSGVTPYNFILTRGGGDMNRPVSVNWSVPAMPNAGVIAADFASGVLPSGTATLAAGQLSTIITVNIAGDSVVEGDEKFHVVLDNPSYGLWLTHSEAVGTIQNDDGPAFAAPTPKFAFENLRAEEMDLIVADLKKFGPDLGDAAMKFLDGAPPPETVEDMVKVLLDLGDMDVFRMLAAFDPYLEPLFGRVDEPSAGVLAGGWDFGTGVDPAKMAPARDMFA